MPRIQQYTRQILPRGMQNMNVPRGAFGDGGRGMANLAAGIEQVGQKLEEIQLRKDQSEYISKATAFELENMQRAQELSNEQFDGSAIDFYRQDFEARAEQFAQSIPQSMMDQWQRDSSRMLTTFAGKGLNEQVRRAGAKAKVDFENTMQTLENIVTMDASRYDEAIQTGMQSVASLPDAVDRMELTERMKDNLRAARASSIINSNPDQFLQMYKDGEFNDLPNAASYSDLAQKAKNAQAAQAEKAFNEQRGIIESRLDLSLALAQSPQELAALSKEITSFQDSYGEEWANDYRTKLVNAADKFETETDLTALGAAIGTGQLVGNPKNNDHKKAIDKFYVSFKQHPEFQAATPEVQNYMIADMLDKAKIVPATLLGEIQTAVRSNDGENLENISNLIDNIETLNPYMLDSLGDISRLRAINAETDRGRSMSQAIEIVDERMNPVNAPREEQIRSEINALKIDHRQEALNGFMGMGDWVNSWFGGGLDQASPAAMIELDYAAADYKYEFERAYRDTRSVDAAHKIAQKSMLNYGRTDVNGQPMVTRFPVEKYYAIENVDNAKWIRQQAIDEAIEWYSTGMSIPRDKSYIEENIRIIPHPTVTRETAKTGQPVYILGLIENGQIINILGENRYWQPDVEAHKKKILSGHKDKKNTPVSTKLFMGMD